MVHEPGFLHKKGAKDGKRSNLFKRTTLEILRTEMENQRSSFITHWRDLGDYVLPRRPRFQITDTNRGQSRNQRIIDSTATMAIGTLSSGMMAGITAPSRPWFRLSIENRFLAQLGPVKEWLEEVTNIMRSIYIRSNLYNVLPTTYLDLGQFGTACMLVEEDFESVARFYSIPIGSYTLANDEKLRPRVFMRELRLTVRQVVTKFGGIDGEAGKPDFTNISGHVQDLWKNQHFETWVDVVHVIKPNEFHDPNRIESRFKKFISIYYERGVSGQNISSSFIEGDLDKILREGGFDEFPILAPRWSVTGEDVWATSCPGMVALGDVKSLQTLQKRRAQAEEKMVNPPMTGPTSLRNSKISILPGDMTFDDSREGQKGFRPSHEVNPRIQEVLLDIQEHQRRISRAYFEDLFLVFTQSDRREITATEIDAKREEKLLALGPVLEQINQDLLDPLTDLVFNFGVRQRMFPEPPEEIQGSPIKVEYVSIMAQAQKLVGLAGIERLTRFVGELAAAKGDASPWDKYNSDRAIEIYGDRQDVDVDIIVPDDIAEEKRAARAKAIQDQQALNSLNQGADTVEKLSSAVAQGSK